MVVLLGYRRFSSHGQTDDGMTVAPELYNGTALTYSPPTIPYSLPRHFALAFTISPSTSGLPSRRISSRYRRPSE